MHAVKDYLFSMLIMLLSCFKLLNIISRKRKYLFYSSKPIFPFKKTFLVFLMYMKITLINTLVGF